MGKWFAGGANKLTLMRVPCTFLVLYGALYAGQAHVGWFWAGAIALAIGFLLDAADGWWARHMSKPTTEGQFLDQLIDKLFFYAILFAFTLAKLDQLWLGWHPLVLVMLALDLSSCAKHYRNYRAAAAVGQFNPNFGAVDWGKWKFRIQCVVLGIAVASLCPHAGPSEASWAAWFSNGIGWLGRTLFVGIYVGMAASIGFALLSLNKRGGNKVRFIREVAHTPL